MESMLLSLLDRTGKLPAKLLELFSRSPSNSSSSSSSSSYSQIVEELQKLHRRMLRIRSPLNAAEEREIIDEAIKPWLDKHRDVAYDAEDIIEEFEYELQRYQLVCEEEERAPITQEKRGIKGKSEVSDSITPPCAPLFDPSFQQRIVAKIRKVNDLFDEIYNEGHAVLMSHGKDGQRHMASLSDPPLGKPTSCQVYEQHVRGRADDQRKVIQMLLSDVDDDGRQYNENVRVVSIVGAAGIGKTTLAQLVSTDDEVVKHFEKRLWVFVSNDFDVTRWLKQILKAIRGSNPMFEELSCLQECLQKELQGKRFLLVLDDVWEDNINQLLWKELWVSLSSGAEGSRVLITTRSENVSRISGGSERNIYRFGCLSYDGTWLLFEKHVFGGRDSGDYPNILSVLKLSYDYLPSTIKPCFAYCAGFPKQHYFDRDELVLLWMAQGYVKPTARKLEEVGREYLRYLGQTSFFLSMDDDESDMDDLAALSATGGEGSTSIVEGPKPSNASRKAHHPRSKDPLRRPFFQHYAGKGFQMNDLIHELALFVSGGECSKFEGGELSHGLGTAHHLWAGLQADVSKLLQCAPTESFHRLRTFCMLGKSCSALSSKLLDDMFLSMRNLRVLDLGAAEISELPDSIGGLKHLRYLRISGGQLVRLPESLGNLLYLQTLVVKRARSLEQLPMCLKKLANLRYLKLHKF